MKWVLFSLFCSFAVPSMSLASCWRPARKWLFALLVATTVVKISVNFCSMETYRGADRGFEVGVTELIAVSLGVGLVSSNARLIRWIPFNLPLLGALFCSLCVSTLGAADPLLASFTLIKVAKGLILYWTVYNLFHIDRPWDGLRWGAVAAAGCLTVAVFYQKYFLGVYRTPGTFDHSNTIPAYSLMLIPLLLGWAMYDVRSPRWQAGVCLAAMLGLCFCVVSTLSRAGAVVMAAIILTMVGWTLLRHPVSLRRTGLAALMLLLLAAGAAKSHDTLLARFFYAPEESYDAREEFNQAALMMAADHTFGVGLNCFSRVLTDTPRYRDHIRVMKHEEQAGVCHQIYLLTAAEIGWLGACLFIAAVARFWLRLLRPALTGATLHHSLLLTMAMGLAAVHVIGLVEWVLRMTPVFNLFLVMTACSVAVAERLDASVAPRRSPGRLLRPSPSRRPRHPLSRPIGAPGGVA